MTKKNEKPDEVEKRIERILSSNDNSEDSSEPGDGNKGSETDQGLWGKVSTGVSVLSGLFNIAANTAGALGRVGASLGRGIKNAFMFAAFERENGAPKRDEDGSLTFSGKRMGKVTAAFALAAAVGLVGLKGAYFYGTQFEELVYTTGKQEIVVGEEYQFSGCNELPCSTEQDNGKFYKIETSLLFPTQIYPEEDVYANIPTLNAACHVKGYGVYFRPLRFLNKSMDWWQQVYSVDCRPLTESEIQNSISGQDGLPSPLAPAPVQQQTVTPN